MSKELKKLQKKLKNLDQKIDNITAAMARKSERLNDGNEDVVKFKKILAERIKIREQIDACS